MRIRFYRIAVIFFFGIVMLGCGADEEEAFEIPDKASTGTYSTLGEIKHQITDKPVAAAPQIPTDSSRPIVTEVGYYKNWKLTKPLTGKVNARKTIYTKVVFSKNMQHVASDTGSARPIISYVIDGKSTRYRIKPHGAKGSSFGSGDCKPLGRGTNTSTFVCKYTVESDDIGTFTQKIGKFSRDTEGKPLAATYRHKEHLQLGSLKPTGIYYFSDSRRTNSLPYYVPARTTVYAEVRFDTPIMDISHLPKLSYRINNNPLQLFRIVGSQAKLHSGEAKLLKRKSLVVCMLTLPQHVTTGEVFIVVDNSFRGLVITPVTALPPVTNPRDFVGRIYIPEPLPGGFTRSRKRPVVGATVTIMAGSRAGESVVTNQTGQYVFPVVKADKLHLHVEKEDFEPKEVTVFRYHPTTLSNGVILKYHEDPQNTPGNILIGHRWPDEVRFILRETLVVYDLLYVEGGTPPPGKDIGGFYGSGVIVIYSEHIDRYHGKAGVFGTFAHEIAHAHQHALVSVDGSGDIWGWKDTSEGKAFIEARRKDWEQVGKAPYDNVPGYDTLDENAAETSAHYWSVNRWGGRTAYGKLAIEAPNRFKWAEEWLNKK